MELRGLGSVLTDKIVDEMQLKSKFNYIRSSNEGVLIDYDLETDFPEVAAAMFATIYGAASLAVEDMAEGLPFSVKILLEKKTVTVLRSREHIVGLISKNGMKSSPVDIGEFLKTLPDEPW